MDENWEEEFDKVEKEVQKKRSLNKLFELWREAHCIEKDFGDTIPKDDKKIIAYNSFYKDGIVNNDMYNNSKVKVLFVSNEASISCDRGLLIPDTAKTIVGDACGNTVGSFRLYAEDNEDEYWSTKMRIKYGEMYRIIIGESIDKENWMDKNREYNNCFAIMNINKRGGFGSIQKNVFNNYVKRYKEFILKEIELLKPDIIIWCGENTYENTLRIIYENTLRTIYNVTNFDENCNIINIKNKKTKIVKMYHTSPQTSSQVKEYLHREIYNEDNVSKYLHHFKDIWDKCNK